MGGREKVDVEKNRISSYTATVPGYGAGSDTDIPLHCTRLDLENQHLMNKVSHAQLFISNPSPPLVGALREIMSPLE